MCSSDLAALLLRYRNGSLIESLSVARYDDNLKRFVAAVIDPGPEGDELYLVLFGTGLRNHGGVGSISATISGVEVQVVYAGAQGTYVGLDQVNLRLPRSLAGRGELNLRLTITGIETNTVRLLFGGE